MTYICIYIYIHICFFFAATFIHPYFPQFSDHLSDAGTSMAPCALAELQVGFDRAGSDRRKSQVIIYPLVI